MSDLTLTSASVPLIAGPQPAINSVPSAVTSTLPLMVWISQRPSAFVRSLGQAAASASPVPAAGPADACTDTRRTATRPARTSMRKVQLYKAQGSGL